MRRTVNRVSARSGAANPRVVSTTPIVVTDKIAVRTNTPTVTSPASKTANGVDLPATNTSTDGRALNHLIE